MPVQYDESASTPLSSSTPTADTIGPIGSGHDDHEADDDRDRGELAPRGEEVRRRTQRQHAAEGAPVVEVAWSVLVARLREPGAEQQHRRTQRQVDREDPAPPR